MDPNVTLRELRSAIESMRRYQDNDTDHPGYCVVPNGTVTTAMERFDALDAWLQGGGFLPAEWTR